MLLALVSALALADSPRVVGGEDAPAGMWPDAAAVWFGSEVDCSGVLIAPNAVLTAGHCAGGITAVTLDATDFERTGERIEVERTIAYPHWARSYDLALLILAHDASVAPRTIAQDCVIDDWLDEGSEVEIVGFGATDAWGNDYGTVLQQAVTSVSDQDCEDLELGCNEEVSPEGELIAGGKGVDSCFGDSGGPLYLLTDGGAFLVGITSRGIEVGGTPCAQGGIYTRPDAVIDWLEEELGAKLPAPDCEALADATAAVEEAGAEADGAGLTPLHYELRACGCSGAPRTGGFGAGLLALGALLWRRRSSGA